jgi:flagellin
MRFIFIPGILFLSSNLLAAESFLFQPTGANFFVFNNGSRQFIINQSKMTGSDLRSVMKKLASGKRINSAADDPAGLAVSQKIESILKGIRQESMNLQDFRNYLRHVDGMAAQDVKILQRIRLLIVRSANGMFTREDREIIQTEIDQFLRQIDMNARFARFNTKGVIPELTVKNLGLKEVNVVRDPYKSMRSVDEALKKVVRRRIIAGVKSNVFTYRIKGVEYYYVNMTESLSKMLDQDLARGISELSKKSILLKTEYGIFMMGK